MSSVVTCNLQAAGNADITVRTPIRLAADQIANLPHITESEVFDTFRLLVDSMDFSEENGNGWEVLHELSLNCDWKVASKALLWMLRLLSFELKTHIVERDFADMLDWLFFYALRPELVEASDLLLNLGGHGIINASLGVTNGYTILHEAIACGITKDRISAVVARGPDLHQRGFDTFRTPFEESPTSLAMYSGMAFSYWLRALASVDVDLENFIDQELERNPEGHTGWEKETLLELFTHGDRPDLHRPDGWTCCDCLKDLLKFKVQPYWRHLLERIKARMHPYDPVSAVSEVDEDESVDLGSTEEVPSSSTDLTSELDTTENVTLLPIDEVPTELESEPVSEADTSEDSVTTPIGSVCLYGKHQLVCIDCWLYYTQTGTRKQPGEPAADEDSSETEDSPSSDDSSECEYSPYLIHS